MKKKISFIIMFIIIVFVQSSFSKVIFQDDFNGYTNRWEPSTTSRYYPNVNSYDYNSRNSTASTWEPSHLPIYERNNKNSWNGWLRNSMHDKISIELDTGINGTPCLQVAPQVGAAVHEKIGLLKWLNDGPNKGGYDELYISWSFKFSDGFRFGKGKGVGYEKWLRLWTKVNLLNMQGHGFGDEKYWGHSILLNYAADYMYPQVPFWGISSYERTDSNTQEYIKLVGSYTKISQDEIGIESSTNYSVNITAGRKMRLKINGDVLTATVVSSSYSDTMNIIKLNTNIKTNPTEVSIQSYGVYQLCGPHSTGGNWYPGYFKTLNPGQLPYYIGPIDSDGYLVNNGKNGNASQEWHDLQIHVKLRDSSLNKNCLECLALDCSDVCGGNNNTGLFEMWIDGILLDEPIKYANGYKKPCLVLSTNEDGGITAISLHDNGTVSSGWTDQQYLWIDNFVISTDPILYDSDNSENQKPSAPFLKINQ